MVAMKTAYSLRGPSLTFPLLDPSEKQGSYREYIIDSNLLKKRVVDWNSACDKAAVT